MRKRLIALAAAIALSFGFVSSASAETGTNPCGAIEPCGMIEHFASSVVYVEDHTTSGLWPIKAALAAWDSGSNLSLRLGDCQPDAGCIIVTEGDEGNAIAGASWAGTQDGNVMTSASNTEFNSAWGKYADLHQREQVTCHELGHSLGLWYHWYDTDSGSCLYYAASDNASTTPSAQDLANINAAYPIAAPDPTPPTPPVPPVKHKPHHRHRRFIWPHITWPHSPWRRS